MKDHIVTEDGKKVAIGERIYNYYDMKAGIVLRYAGNFPDPWFDIKHDDGSISVLNGQRVCSIEYAAKRGFVGA